MTETAGMLPPNWALIELADLDPGRNESLDPRKAPSESFDIYSVPAFPSGTPEILTGAKIGSSKQKVVPGTVLLCGINPRINRVWVVAEPNGKQQIASTEWIAFPPTPGIDPKYLSYFLQRNEIRDYLARKASGVGGSLMRVKGRTCAQIRFPLAPHKEQWRIVSEIEKQFTRLEAGVAALKRVQANLKRYRAAVLKAALEGRLVPTEAELARREGCSYEAADQLLQRILAERRARWEADQLAKFRASGKEPKDDKWKAKYEEPGTPNAEKLSPPPEGWVWAQLDQLLVYLRNGIPRKPDLELGIPILRISAVRPLRVDMNDVRFLSGNLEDYAGYVLQEGDLLFTRYNGNPVLTGVCGIVRTVHRPTVHPDKLIRAKVAKEMCSSAFLEIAVNVGASRDFIARRVRTTAGQAGISGGDLRSIPVPLAPAAEQQRIVAEVERRLSVIEDLEMQVEANLKRAERLRQAILKRAFEGKLVPQDPSDEPASVLLERIRAVRDAMHRNLIESRRPRRAQKVKPEPTAEG